MADIEKQSGANTEDQKSGSPDIGKPMPPVPPPADDNSVASNKISFIPAYDPARHWASHLKDLGLVEEIYINRYAVFMAYMSMAMKGLGFLVITWTTVVLLGGFVSALGTKDFWSLTVITLIQTIGVFDIFPKQKLFDIGYLYSSLMLLTLIRPYEEQRERTENCFPKICNEEIRVKLKVALFTGGKLLLQALIFGLILLPLLALYIFGLYISMGVSLWRLVQHDYGTDGDDAKAHLKPALYVLYSTALLQGVPLCYMAVYACQEKMFARTVADVYKFSDASRTSVEDYLRETKIGCEKDPSFANGRTLVTYAVELLESRSPARCISGLMILETIIQAEIYIDQLILIRQLIRSASTNPIHQKLLEITDPSTAYSETTRESAKNIVKFLGINNLQVV